MFPVDSFSSKTHGHITNFNLIIYNSDSDSFSINAKFHTKGVFIVPKVHILHCDQNLNIFTITNYS